MGSSSIQFIGEHLWVGELGNISIIVAFAAALLSSLSYFSAARMELITDAYNSWLKLARLSFYIHSLAVVGIIAALFFMLFNHYFEYQYALQHSNRGMAMKYIASCFWEGQEGSFLLWTFWHVVIGLVLKRRSGEWEAPVMAVITLVQVFLCSMLLGIHIFNYKVGSNPFTLVRHMPENIGLPWTTLPDYLSLPLFADGRGLNPLLQNYWMVIHPPTLFLGFASTVVPFAFAIAGLWKKKYTEWQKPALPWTFFGIMILGTGILMGGAWAYEALSFGGFWAWDPVENASLVPWITFVGAGHVMMIHKNKGESLFATFFLTMITFILVLYSTFLTRSGVLGDSSVHAFTDLGMLWQLVVYLFFFLILSITLVINNFKAMPRSKQEDSATSREFWMFIGALILLLSAFQISVTTSIPVFNKILGTKWAPPIDLIAHYNKYQICFSIVILALMGVIQYFRYKKTDPAEVRKSIIIPLISSFVISLVITILFKWYVWGISIFYAILLFSCFFAILGNAFYFIRNVKGKFANAGPSVAHIGFATVLLGALISTSRSENISFNRKGDVEVFGKDFSNQKNILLMKNDTVQMGDYYVSYRQSRKEGVNIFYDVEYMEKSETGVWSSAFMLSPRVQVNPKMGSVAEPDTRHFLHKDIYTHIKYADLEPKKEVTTEGYSEPHNNNVAVGDTFFTTNSIVVVEKIVTQVDKEKLGIPKADITAGALLKIFDISGKVTEAMPVYYITDSLPNTVEAKVDELGLKFAFWQINPETGKVDISVAEKPSDKKEYIVLQATVFPGINILWTGCLIMIIGTVMAIRKRLKSKAE